MNSIARESYPDEPDAKECLLRQDNFVSKSVSVKREGRELDWEARPVVSGDQLCNN